MVIWLWFQPGLSQTDSLPSVEFGGAFEVSRSERIDLLAAGSGGPVLIATADANIYLRPLAADGTPKKVLSIRSNDTKRIEQFEYRHDTLVALVKATNRPALTTYELVTYSAAGDSLAEVHRHTVGWDQSDKKPLSEIFMHLSPAGAKVVIGRQQPFSSATNATIEIEVTDVKKGTTFGETLPLPYDADDVQLMEMAVNDSGVVYVALRLGVKLDSPFMRKHLLLTYAENRGEMTEFDFSAHKRYADDIAIHLRDSLALVAMLFTDDPFAENKSVGCQFALIDSAGTHVSQRNTFLFDPTMKAENRLDNDQLWESRIQHLQVQQIAMPCGEPLVIADQRFRDQICTTDPRTGIMTCTDQFHFNTINLFNPLANQNNIAIGRRQIDYNRAGPFVSHLTYQSADAVYLLYNDHFKNESTDAERPMNNASRSALRLVKVDCNGQMQTRLISTAKTDHVLISTLNGYVDGTSLVGLYSNGSTLRLGRVDINKVL